LKTKATIDIEKHQSIAEQLSIGVKLKQIDRQASLDYAEWKSRR